MKKYKYSFTKKAIAAFLSAIVFVLIIAGAVGIVYMAEYDYYSSTLTQVKKAAQSQMVYDKLDMAYELFYYGEDPAEYFENTNFEKRRRSPVDVQRRRGPLLGNPRIYAGIL